MMKKKLVSLLPIVITLVAMLTDLGCFRITKESDSPSDADSDTDTKSGVDSETDPNILPDGGIGCDPVKNTGCLDGERCSIYFEQSGNTYTYGVDCFENASTLVAPGEACLWAPVPEGVNVDNCQGGSTCLSGKSANPTCSRLCRETDASSCAGAYDGQDGICKLVLNINLPGVMLCIAPIECDPHCQSGCDSGDICMPLGDGTNKALSCIPSSRETNSSSPDYVPGPGIAGEICTKYINSCAVGHLCINKTCHSICDLDPPENPGNGDLCDFVLCAGTCTAFSASTSFFNEFDVGYCVQ